jgi:hypothetical protein
MCHFNGLCCYVPGGTSQRLVGMIRNLIIHLILFVAFISAMACAFISFFLDENDKINANNPKED